MKGLDSKPDHNPNLKMGSRLRSLRKALLLSAGSVLIVIGLHSGGAGPLGSAAMGETAFNELSKPPADGVMGFVVENFDVPFVAGRDACHNGPVKMRDGYLETVPPAERTRLLLAKNAKELDAKWKAFAFGPNGANVCTNPEMFQHSPLPTVQSSYSWGLNLDDADGGGAKGCVQEDFISPTGERGIDNQEYRVMGCTHIWRQEDGEAAEVATAMKQFHSSGQWTQVILLRGVDSLVQDDNVEVIYANTSDRPYLDNDGRFLAGTTFTVNAEGARARNVLKGRIENGVLTTEPKTIRLAQTWGQGGARDIRGHRTQYVFQSGRVRLAFQPDGSLKGTLGGYRPLFDVIASFALGGAGSAIIAGIDCAAELATLKKLADGIRDPKTGECTAVSSAMLVEAIPAFVNDKPNRARTAAR